MNNVILSAVIEKFDAFNAAAESLVNATDAFNGSLADVRDSLETLKASANELSDVEGLAPVITEISLLTLKAEAENKPVDLGTIIDLKNRVSAAMSLLEDKIANLED